MASGVVIPFPRRPSQPTLPHILRPLEGESLLGFCLRLDLANGLPLGSVATRVKNHATAWHSLRAASWASGAIFDLPALAALSGTDPDVIEELTFMPALRRLFGHDMPIESLGRWLRESMCESCWREERLLRRVFLLEDVTACLVHRERLVPFGRDRLAVLDPGAPRADVDELEADELARQRDLARLWSLVLERGTPQVIGAGYRLAADLGHGQAPGIRGAATRLQNGRHAVATLVRALLALGIEPDVLLDAIATDEEPDPCPNATCPRYTADWPAGLAVEAHCRVCGTRFRGSRILSTFDIDHGSSSPSRRAVYRAQVRLRRWRSALSVTCAHMFAEDEPITIGEAFRRAGVPDGAYLRAERLGLTALVRDAGRRQRLAHSRSGEAFSSIGMDDFRVLMTAARERDWVGIAEWASERQVHPTLPDRPGRYGAPPFTREGLLDPLFSGAWMRTVRNQQEIVDVWRLVQSQDPSLLSSTWYERRVRRRA
jgi:hypothetical protein